MTCVAPAAGHVDERVGRLAEHRLGEEIIDRRIECTARAPSSAASDRMSTAELPAPTTSTRLPLTCSFDFTSWECSISPSKWPG